MTRKDAFSFLNEADTGNDLLEVLELLVQETPSVTNDPTN
jgi:hypothetical protein